MTQDETSNLLLRKTMDILKLIHEVCDLEVSLEREACAKLVEQSSLPDAYSEECLPDIANEIRERGQA